MTPRAHRWWHGVEAVADAEAGDPSGVDDVAALLGVREPWADQGLLAATLTPAQQAVLAGLDDQPDGPRLDGLETSDPAPDQPSVPRLRPGNGTGNAPGDPEAADLHHRSRWTVQEQER
jgi:hypothetical protein